MPGFIAVVFLFCLLRFLSYLTARVRALNTLFSRPGIPTWPVRGWGGFTLVELLIVLAIISILAGLALPAFNDAVARGKVRDAAEAIYGLLLQAKSEAPLRDKRLYVTVDGAAGCVGVGDGGYCDCTIASGAGGCVLPVAGQQVRYRLGLEEFDDVSISENFPGAGTSFMPIRRTASPAGTVEVRSRGQIIRIKVALNGRIRQCVPSGSAIHGYSQC